MPSSKLLLPAICFTGFFLGIEIGGFQYILLPVAEDFGLSESVMGSLVSVQFAAITVAPLLTGGISDIIGKKKLCLVFSAMFVLGAFLCIISKSFMSLAAGLFIVGFSLGALESSTTAALSDAFPHKSGKYINIMQCILNLGAVLSPLLVRGIMKSFGTGWNILFYICFAGFIISFILFIFAKFTSFIYKDSGPKINAEDVKKIFNKVIIGCMICIFLYVAMENGTTFFLGTFFTDTLSSADFSAYAISAFWMTAALSKLIASFFYKYQNMIILGCFISSAVSLVLLGMTPNHIWGIMFVMMIGLSYGPIWPFLVSNANQQCPKYTGTVTSFMMAAGGAGGIVSPVLIGFIGDNIDVRIGYIVLSGLSIIGLFSFWKTVKNEKSEKSSMESMDIQKF